MRVLSVTIIARSYPARGLGTRPPPSAVDALVEPHVIDGEVGDAGGAGGRRLELPLHARQLLPIHAHVRAPTAHGGVGLLERAGRRDGHRRSVAVGGGADAA